MRGAAPDVGLHVGDAGGAQHEGLALGGGRLEGQHVVGRQRFLLDQLARAEGAFLLVGVEQHRDAGEVAEAVGGEQAQRVQDDRRAAKGDDLSDRDAHHAQPWDRPDPEP